MKFERISDSSFYCQEREALVIFSSTPNMDVGKVQTISPKNIKKSIKVQFWGEKNLLPQERKKLVSENNIVGTLIATKRDITVGSGLMCYRERIIDGIDDKPSKRIIDEIITPTEMQAFFDKLEHDDYFLKACGDLMFHQNVFTEFVRAVDGKPMSIKHLPAEQVRAEEQDVDGFIKNYYRSGFWHKINDPKSKVTEINNYNDELEEAQNRFLLHCGDSLLNDGTYNIPTWWGSKTWIELANAIAHFHKSNLENGFSIRYIIEVDRDYFRNNSSSAQTPEEILVNSTAENQAKSEFTDRMNDLLAGEKNAGRAIFTEMETNRANGQQYSGVKVTPLTVDLKDEAMLRLFESSNQAVISAQGMHPTLASIETQGKLSSGTEIRNAFLMYLIIKTPLPRAILLKPIKLFAKLMGWDPTIKFGFRDVELAALSEDKSGSKESTQVK